MQAGHRWHGIRLAEHRDSDHADIAGASAACRVTGGRVDEHEPRHAAQRLAPAVDVEGLPLEQVTKQLNKLVNVIKIVELEQSASVQREHMLIKVRADNQTRSNVIEVVNLFRASIVDYATDALVIEVTGDRGKVDALLRALEPFGIKELAQSGMVAIGRGGKSITERVLRS